MNELYLAGGCFWCIADVYTSIDGVIDVISGYSGGDEVNPTYEEVKSQTTGHRETIKIIYDESIISFEDLTEEYKLSKNKIINLRKNNYKLYNTFFEHWKIEKEIAVLGLCPKHERALNIVKKFYKNKIEIISCHKILYKGEVKNINEIIEMADEILKKDNICCFKDLDDIKNFY